MLLYSARVRLYVAIMPVALPDQCYQQVGELLPGSQPSRAFWRRVGATHQRLVLGPDQARSWQSRVSCSQPFAKEAKGGGTRQPARSVSDERFVPNRWSSPAMRPVTAGVAVALRFSSARTTGYPSGQ